MTIALVSLAACLVGMILVAVFDHPAPPEPIRVPVQRPMGHGVRARGQSSAE